jgi:hypothetical protein
MQQQIYKTRSIKKSDYKVVKGSCADKIKSKTEDINKYCIHQIEFRDYLCIEEFSDKTFKQRGPNKCF